MFAALKTENLLDSGFRYVHQNNLVYVTCWEDPRLDREAMNLTENDNVLVVTSAGCNAIEYALDAPNHVYAVDVNPRQNALLELKISGVKNLDFPSFFMLFGDGYLPNFNEIYRESLRPSLSPFAQQYWDANGLRFFGSKNSLFFRGTSGIFARSINFYIDQVVRLREEFNELLAATSVEQQHQIYYDKIHHKFWKSFLYKFLNLDVTLWMLGVPPQQRWQMERFLEKGVADFIKSCCLSVFTELSMQDNYFWRVFIEGKYTPHCCPEYLKPENFQRLKDGLIDRVSVHTNTVTQFLEQEETEISHFVLLDHMDWLSNYKYTELEHEWQAIVRRARQKSRILFRSAGFQVDYVDPIHVSIQNQKQRLGDLLTYHHDWAEELHKKDRVHTYGSFYIADLALA